ncbi:MAG: chromosomal replication initiator protein DnaA [Atopobiaceae bacterium]
MDATNESDAIALWEDALDLLAQQGLPASTIAMFKSCRATALDDEALHIETSSRFVQRTVSRKAEQIEKCLAEVAFAPLKLVVQSAAPDAKPLQTNSELSSDEFERWNQATARKTEPVPGTRAQGVMLSAAANATATAAAPTAQPVSGEAAQAAAQPQTPAAQAGVATAATAPSPAEAPMPQATSASAPTMSAPAQPSAATDQPFQLNPTPRVPPRRKNPLVQPMTDADLKYTFDRFVEGPQNRFALNAAKQVANGQGMGFNPLFIYGKSGLGKTHLLKAIWNYIDQNDPTRTCVYRMATDFIDDYTKAMKNARTGAAQALTDNYHDVDVLIIDDVQSLGRAAGTIGFFFDTFNYLVSHGKQIVMAADRTPSELGMGGNNFDERVTSRLDSGFTIGVQVPDYEMKLQLVDAFCEHMRIDSINEHIPGMDVEIPEDLRKLMAERAGTNIRTIEGFVRSCLMYASQKASMGQQLTAEDVRSLAKQKWPTGQKVITVEQIQKAVEDEYGVAHADLVGSKRNKELMEPRHVAIWLTRELTDDTLADIGKKFGGRTHATIKHSIGVVDEMSKTNRVLHDRIERIRDAIGE